MRVHRSFGFIDLCGFTAFTDVHGDGKAVEVLAQFRATVREVASENGVRVAKWLGDGAMFVSVDGVDLPGTLLEVGDAWASSGSPLALRAGLAEGAVILFEGDDYIGTAVNLAARLCDLAGPHEMVAPAGLDVDAEQIGAGAVSVPGLARPIEIVRYVLDGGRGNLRLIAPA